MANWNHQLARKQLEKEGRTRKWVADQCGISQSMLSRLLSGLRQPSKPVRKLLAQALNVREEELERSPGSDDTSATDPAKAAS
jgi:transcriptional regulator with XRE-family HTH domain